MGAQAARLLLLGMVVCSTAYQVHNHETCCTQKLLAHPICPIAYSTTTTTTTTTSIATNIAPDTSNALYRVEPALALHHQANAT